MCSNELALINDTKKLLQSILSGKQFEVELNSLVHLCHSLAIPYVAKRLNKDSILRGTLGLDVSDFAYDCIADLFAFSGSGQFPHFHAYFAAFPLASLSDAEAVSHLRRLVFSHANQGIFRLYNQVDPTLGKIIRNVKLALQEFTSLELVEQFGEQRLAPSGCDQLIQFRTLDAVELETGLGKYLHGTENIPFMLGKLALFLREQEYTSRVVSLTIVAIVFRSLYKRAADVDLNQDMEKVETVSDDLNGVIRKAVKSTMKRAQNTYARKKNMDVGLLEVYFRVIEKRFVLIHSGDGVEVGLRELLKEHFPDMSADEYKKKHRSRLEYLSRLTGLEVGKELREI